MMIECLLLLQAVQRRVWECVDVGQMKWKVERKKYRGGGNSSLIAILLSLVCALGPRTDARGSCLNFKSTRFHPEVQ